MGIVAKGKSDFVNALESMRDALGAAVLERTLAQGKTIEIPSLGIGIEPTGDGGAREVKLPKSNQ